MLLLVLVTCLCLFIIILCKDAPSWSIRDNAIVKDLIARKLLVITPYMLDQLEIDGSEYVLKLLVTKTETKFAGFNYRAKIDRYETENNKCTPIDIKTVAFSNDLLEKLVGAGLFQYTEETHQLLNIAGGHFIVTLLIDKYGVRSDALEYRAQIKIRYGMINTKLDTEPFAGLILNDVTLIKNYNDLGVTLMPIHNFTYVYTMYYTGDYNIPVKEFARADNFVLEKIIKYKMLPSVYNNVLMWYK